MTGSGAAAGNFSRSNISRRKSSPCLSHWFRPTTRRASGSCSIPISSTRPARRRSTSTSPRSTAGWWRSRFRRTAARKARCIFTKWKPGASWAIWYRASRTRPRVAVSPGARMLPASTTRATHAATSGRPRIATSTSRSTITGWARRPSRTRTWSARISRASPRWIWRPLRMGAICWRAWRMAMAASSPIIRATLMAIGSK